MTDEQIKRMVDRFLAWQLPATFAPDGGISFQRIGEQPVGTNVFTAIEAEAMVRHMLDAVPPEQETLLRVHCVQVGGVVMISEGLTAEQCEILKQRVRNTYEHAELKLRDELERISAETKKALR